MQKQIYFLMLVCFLAATTVRGEEYSLTLAECIARARMLSVDAEVARGELRAAYWQYRSYRAERLPEVLLDASLPSYHKQYSSYMNDRGEYSFVRNNYVDLNGSLSLSQTIIPTVKYR